MSTVVTYAEARVPIDAELTTFGAWLKRFISTAAIERLEEAHSRATVGLFRHAMDVLTELGFTDATLAVIDKSKIFVDLREAEGDTAAMVQAVLGSEALLQPFGELRVVLGRQTRNAHWLTVVRLDPGPPGDPPRLRVDIAARPDALSVQSGDSVTHFRDRVLAWAADAPAIAALVAEVLALGTAFEVSFAERLPEAEATSRPATLELIDLDETDVGRLRHLAFGKFVRDPTYRADPPYTRSAPNDGPFDYYRYDPYEPLARWWLIDALIAGALRHQDVALIAADGTELARGHTLSDAALAGLVLPREVVQIVGDELVIASTIAEVQGLDVAEALSQHVPGYGGSGEG